MPFPVKALYFQDFGRTNNCLIEVLLKWWDHYCTPSLITDSEEFRLPCQCEYLLSLIASLFNRRYKIALNDIIDDEGGIIRKHLTSSDDVLASTTVDNVISMQKFSICFF